MITFFVEAIYGRCVGSTKKKFRNNIAILFFMVIISTMGIWIIGKLY